MWVDVSQARNSSGSFPPKDHCKNTFKVAAIMTDTHASKRGLNKTGTLLLEEHLRLHPEDTYPTSHTRNALLAQVRKAQDNQDITYNAISKWFQRRRLKLQKQSTTSLTPQSPTMPFGQDNLHKLQTLIKATPNPSPEVLDTWASLFRVSKAMLEHAIHVILPGKDSQDARQAQTDAEQGTLHRLSIGPSNTRLPTPANSSTPEPVPATNDEGSPEFMKKECRTPTLAHSNATHSGRGMGPQFQQPRYHSATGSVPTHGLHNPVAHSQLSPPLTPTVPTTRVNAKASETTEASTTPARIQIPCLTHSIFSGIAEACSDAAHSTPEGDSLPRTAAEFEALFAPYKTKLEMLSRMLKATFENQPSNSFST